MNEETTRTEINELGEFGLIKHLTQNFKIKNESTLRGVGDDAAVLDFKNKKIVVTTDLLVEGIHFDLMYVPLKHLGYKSVMVNLSDVYAMNATPKQITVSIGISSRFSVEALTEIYDGIFAACKKHNVDLIGGDTTSSLKGLIISITAIGEAEEKDIVYRNGAKVNELICVTGDLGAAYMGLQILEREKKIFLEAPQVQPDLENQKYIVGRQLMPEARKDIFDLLREWEVVPTSMIDISDGLSSEIFHLCEQSDLGCRIDESKIPIAEETFNQALKFNLDPTTCALNGGEDYELLFTIKQSDFEKIKNHPQISVIGFMTEKTKGKKLITKAGNEFDLKAQGWKSV